MSASAPASSALTPFERSATLALSGIFLLRMLGLFMLSPVLALYANKLPGATPLMVGLTLGVYGLTQASLQIPFGALSDRIGRKPVIAAGLIIFTAGSAIAALAHHIVPIMIGRAVQGAGAVSGATMALAADLTRDDQRTKVMALLGISIGMAYSLAIWIGPEINALGGLNAVFLVSGTLGLLALPVLLFVVPAPVRQARRTEKLSWRTVTAPELRVLYFGVFALHLVSTASFVAIPVDLAEGLGIPSQQHSHVYLPVLFVSILLVAPLIRASTRPGLLVKSSCAAIATLAIAEAALWGGWHHAWPTYVALVLFFTGFNFLEASLPGLISRAAPPEYKGTALGAYATFQFLGLFAGGALGGLIADRLGFAMVPLACAALCAVWFFAALRAPIGGAAEDARTADA